MIDISRHVGELAGLTTSVLWTGTSLLFTAAARRIGPTAVNATRLALAIVLLGVTHRYLTGHWVPVARGGQVAYLALSGVIGLSIGDQALLTAFVEIGPRLSSLIMTTAPIFAAVLGFTVLGESLSLRGLFGMALTVSGVAWVILERPLSPTGERHAPRPRGVLLALVGALCQAGGLLLSKQGMGHGWLPEEEHIAPQTATFIRMMFGGLGMVPILLVHGLRERHRRTLRSLPDVRPRRASGLLFACGGAVVGPFLGVWMSLVASDRAPLGVAQTLCSLTPLFLIPCVAVIYKERISPRAILGAVAAVGGVALLFVRRG
jgi:drug/metabolite transporter (DMT)-like permease